MSLRTFLAGATLAIALAGAASAQPVKIGIAAEPYPPFTSPNAAGEWEGWEVDIIEAVCAAAEMECEIVPVAWDGIIPALTGQRIDVIMSSMSITEARRQVIDFSDKYYNAPIVVVGPKSLEMDASPDSLAGKVLGVQVSTIHEAYSRKYFEPAGATIQVYQTQEEANQDLVAGRIDATQADSIALDAFLSTEAGACCEVKGTVADDQQVLGLGVGAGVRKGDDALREKINAAIAKIRADGTYDAITANYFATSIYGD